MATTPTAANADVFQSNIQFGGAMRLNKAVVVMAGTENLVLMGLNWSYQAGSDVILPINQNKKYIIQGDPRGEGSIQMLVGPAGAISAFIRQMADLCNISTNVLTIDPSAIICSKDKQTPDRFNISGMLLNRIGGQVSKTAGGNMIITDLGFTFMSLGLVDGTTTA